jgi:hypothetical protein
MMGYALAAAAYGQAQEATMDTPVIEKRTGAISAFEA